MPIQLADIQRRNGPRYLAITDALEEAIRAGRLAPGDRLPTHRQLADVLQVTVGTVTRAYGEAANRGLVNGEVGRGSYVAKQSVERNALMELFPCPAQGEEEPLDLGAVLPANGGQHQYLSQSLHALAGANHLAQSMLQYTPQPGVVASHQEAGAAWLAQWLGDEVDPGRVFNTNGGQQGLALAYLSACTPGDTVAVENLGWSGIKALATSLNIKLAGVEMDDEGMTPDSLDAVCAARNVRAIVCSSSMQNPTCTTMSIERREAIVAAARKYDLPIIEDGVFDCFQASVRPPLATLAPERTFYVNSYSKTLGAGLRGGLLYPPAGMFDRVAGHNRAMLICTPRFIGDILAQWVRDGIAEQILTWQLAEFAYRRQAAHEIFAGIARVTAEASWLWVELPPQWSPGQFAQHVSGRNIIIWPSEQFSIGGAPAPSAVRIALGGVASRDDVLAGLSAVAECLHETPAFGMG